MTPYEIIDDIGRCGYSFLQLNDGSIRCATVGYETDPLLAWMLVRRHLHPNEGSGEHYPMFVWSKLRELVFGWDTASQLKRAFGAHRFTFGNPYRERVLRLLK